MREKREREAKTKGAWMEKRRKNEKG